MQSDFLHVAGQANRRKLRVFSGTLAVALIASLAFTWLRHPEYRASSRLEIAPGVAAAASALPPANEAASASAPFLTEVQVLTSRPVLEVVAADLTRSGYDLSNFGPDPVTGMQSRLETIPVPGTHVVELAATAEHPELLAPLINTTISVYQDRLEKAFRESSSEALDRADDEVAKLEVVMTTKRLDVEAFRIRNNIVSLERDENEVLARVRNLGTSFSAANEKVAAAEGRLNSLTESAAAGQAVVRSRDNPTLANLEQRASQIREELRDVELGFTPDYMAKDPKIINQRARLAELERQIAAERIASQQTALLEAKQELASARSTAARIRNEIASGRQEVAQFTARFNEYKSRQDELARLETAYQDAIQRRAKFGASERERMPMTKIVEAATTPQEPWRPLYWRDTALSIGGSLVLALLTMWLIELFNRREPQPAVVLIQPPASVLTHDAAPQALAGKPAAGALETTVTTLLPRPVTFPRELRRDEIDELIRACDDSSRLITLLLLSGVSVEEALKLHWSDVDLPDATIHVGDEPSRDVVMGAALRNALTAYPRAPGSNLLLAQPGRLSTHDSVDAQILCAALDAGIRDATEVTSDCLRHTYIAHLVRQGIRFSDLTRLVGNLPPDAVRRYSSLSPPGPRTRIAEVELMLPALRDRDVQ